MFNITRFFLVFSLIVISQIGYASSQKWEYLSKTIILQSDDFTTKQLNKLGAQNWELISCAEASAKLVCIFKRKI